jgi:predicted PhzF superfamily epimerase YddE/YHI9
MGYPIHIVDVFTDRALTVIQLAVVLDAGDKAWQPEDASPIVRKLLAAPGRA